MEERIFQLPGGRDEGRPMKHTDYHGSRSYEADNPPVTHLSLMATWARAIFQHKMSGWLKVGARRPPSRRIVRDSKRGFSILGGENLPNARPADCPFPTRPINDNPRDWRVFP
jgi:hypothetical protein